MKPRVVKIEVIPHIVWDDGDNLHEVSVIPLVIDGDQYWAMIHDGGLAAEFDLLTSKIVSAYSGKESA